MKQWTEAAADSDCIVIGDINLDILKWDHPDQLNVNMVEATKLEIQSIGFHQLVQGVTRAWKGQRDSLIDHIWTNQPALVANVSNRVEAHGDHNLIMADVMIKKMPTVQQNFKKRKMSNFSKENFCKQIRQINWQHMYKMNNIDLANTFFEESVSGALNSIAPIITVQPRTKHKSWVTSQTRDQMKLRDSTREEARLTQDPETWNNYRIIRNKCTKLVNRDKKQHFEKKYTQFTEENDCAALYKTSKLQLGWASGGPPGSFLKKWKNNQCSKSHGTDAATIF